MPPRKLRLVSMHMHGATMRAICSEWSPWPDHFFILSSSLWLSPCESSFSMGVSIFFCCFRFLLLLITAHLTTTYADGQDCVCVCVCAWRSCQSAGLSSHGHSQSLEELNKLDERGRVVLVLLENREGEEKRVQVLNRVAGG